MPTLLVTGGAGFIGSHYVLRRSREHPRDRLVVLDALTYAGRKSNLGGLLEGASFRFVRGDIQDAALVRRLLAEEAPDAILHFAAETHVDRSLADPGRFTRTNVLGTEALLEAARARPQVRVIVLSTDEVYGPLADDAPPSREDDPLRPSSPYSASKAAAELLALAHHRSFGTDVVVIRASNNYGSRQYPEKLIPLMIRAALQGKPLPLYGDGQQRRDWIHVRDHCAAIDRILESGRPGAVYNVGARSERSNRWVVDEILAVLGPERAQGSAIRSVADRPGHDRRYGIDPSRLETELGFTPQIDLAAGLRETIEWYAQNPAWSESALAEATDGFHSELSARLLGR